MLSAPPSAKMCKNVQSDAKWCKVPKSAKKFKCIFGGTCWHHIRRVLFRIFGHQIRSGERTRTWGQDHTLAWICSRLEFDLNWAMLRMSLQSMQSLQVLYEVQYYAWTQRTHWRNKIPYCSLARFLRKTHYPIERSKSINSKPKPWYLKKKVQLEWSLLVPKIMYAESWIRVKPAKPSPSGAPPHTSKVQLMLLAPQQKSGTLELLRKQCCVELGYIHYILTT